MKQICSLVVAALLFISLPAQSFPTVPSHTPHPYVVLSLEREVKKGSLCVEGDHPVLKLCAATLVSPAGRVPALATVALTIAGVAVLVNPRDRKYVLSLISDSADRIKGVVAASLLLFATRRQSQEGKNDVNNITVGLALATIATFSKYGCDEDGPKYRERVIVNDRRHMEVESIRISGPDPLIEAYIQGMTRMYRTYANGAAGLKKDIQNIFRDNAWGDPDPCWEEYIPPPFNALNG